jgi:hypothetical protein
LSPTIIEVPEDAIEARGIKIIIMDIIARNPNGMARLMVFFI